jgi:hypothetical protein
MQKEIVRSYKVTLEDLYNALGGLFRKHEIDGKLTYEEMTRYGRIGKMNKELAITTAQLYKEVSQEIKRGLTSAYEAGFNGTSSILVQETGKRLRSIIRLIKPLQTIFRG